MDTLGDFSFNFYKRGDFGTLQFAFLGTMFLQKGIYFKKERIEIAPPWESMFSFFRANPKYGKKGYASFLKKGKKLLSGGANSFLFTVDPFSEGSPKHFASTAFLESVSH